MVFWHAAGATAIFLVGLVAGRRAWVVRRNRRRHVRRHMAVKSGKGGPLMDDLRAALALATMDPTHLASLTAPCVVMQLLLFQLDIQRRPAFIPIRDRLLDDTERYFKELAQVMLDALAEISKFRPLPADESEVPAMGGQSGRLDQVSHSLTKLAKQQYRSGNDLKMLLDEVQKLASGALGGQLNATVANSEEAESKLIHAFLPIVDTFDDAYRAVLELGDPVWSDKFERFMSAVNHQLDELDLKPLPGEGAAFNSDYHEAIGVYSASDPAHLHRSPNSVAIVYRRGFLWKGRLLRRAQVIPVR